jgi:hypothetical protein
VYAIPTKPHRRSIPAAMGFAGPARAPGRRLEFANPRGTRCGYLSAQ